MRHVTEDPCTRNNTGRGGSPVVGASRRLRNINSGTLPFFAQYSWLQMSFRLAASAGVARLHRIRALKPNPAFFEISYGGAGRRRICSLHLVDGCCYKTLGRRPYFRHASRLPEWRGPRPAALVLLGVRQVALSWRAGVNWLRGRRQTGGMMLKWLRAVARFFQKTIGWNRIGVLLSVAI